MILNILAGFLAGCLCACGGAIKDAPYEGFKPLVFLRSPIVGTLCGLATVLITHEFVVALFCAGYLERVVVEGWKICRVKVPGKFSVGEWGVKKNSTPVHAVGNSSRDRARESIRIAISTGGMIDTEELKTAGFVSVQRWAKNPEDIVQMVLFCSEDGELFTIATLRKFDSNGWKMQHSVPAEEFFSSQEVRA